MSASSTPGLRPPPPPNTPLFGQVVAVNRVSGRQADSIQQRVNRGEQRVVLIPWGYQANCSPILWTGSARWVEPGSVGLFTAQLRPANQWVAGLPTFDVGAAWYQPYPFGEFFKYGRQRTDTGGPELTVSELWGLYTVLPTPDSLQSSGITATVPARAWARAHPSEAKRWPARRILELLEFLSKPENR